MYTGPPALDRREHQGAGRQPAGHALRRPPDRGSARVMARRGMSYTIRV